MELKNIQHCIAVTTRERRMAQDLPCILAIFSCISPAHAGAGRSFFDAGLVGRHNKIHTEINKV